MSEQDYAACPSCGQYSHSIPDDKVGEAFRHFQSMCAHPVRGHPMGQNFDDQTRDAAQAMAAEIKRLRISVQRLQAALRGPMGER